MKIISTTLRWQEAAIARAASGAPRAAAAAHGGALAGTASLHTRILNFRGFDSSIILSLKGGFLMSIGNFP